MALLLNNEWVRRKNTVTEYDIAKYRTYYLINTKLDHLKEGMLLPNVVIS